MSQRKEGLDLDNVFETTKEEVDQNLSHIWSWRGPLYETYAMSLYMDHAPDFGKLSRWSGEVFGRLSGSRNVLLASVTNIHHYMMLGWETGIRNEFYVLWRNGMTKEQLLDLVMFAQCYAGMRGLGHVYHAVGDMLPAWGVNDNAAEWPEGWAADNDALKCGLDLSTRELTPSDLENLTRWYEETIGYVPDSIKFGIKWNPKYIKLNRARWEVTMKVAPKQIIPYTLIGYHTRIQNAEGLREAALLGKAWGLTPELIQRAVTNCSMYFTHFEGMYAAANVIDPILENWD